MKHTQLQKIRGIKPDLAGAVPREAEAVGIHSDGRIIYEMKRYDVAATKAKKKRAIDPTTGEPAWEMHPTTGAPMYPKYVVSPVYRTSRFVLEASPRGKVSMNENFEESAEAKAAMERKRAEKEFADQLAQEATLRGITAGDIVARIVDGLGDFSTSARSYKSDSQAHTSDSGDADQAYPRHKGGRYWELSDGSTIEGKRADAESAESALGTSPGEY